MTGQPVERAILIGADVKGEKNLGFPLEDSLDELGQLAHTAGIEVVGRTQQHMNGPNPATFIGKGKVEELQALRDQTNADVVIFDDELSPRQQRELEEALEPAKVLDRTALILDIFAHHARTREGALQVELAQYEYRLPRLTRQWTHLSRQTGSGGTGAGAGVGLRGPGETQLESDRRDISRRIAHLKREIDEVRMHRRLSRERRRQAAVSVVAIVGYTNAGKSTLLNVLTGADVLAEDILFATLDPTTRRVALPSGREVLLTDTVGFIQKLPTTLVASFRATLEEIAEADVLLHVVDVTHPHVAAQVTAVEQTLRELGATDKPLITALNKIDQLPDPDEAARLAARTENAVAISAVTGQGLEALLAAIDQVLQGQMVPVTVRLPFAASELVALFHKQGLVETERHTQKGTTVRGRLPAWLVERYHDYRVE